MAANAMAMTASPLELDRYVVDTLMVDLVGHDRHPSAFLVYLALASAESSGRVALSHAQLAERTGLSKRSVQNAVERLKRRNLIDVYGDGPTEVRRYNVYTPWRKGWTTETGRTYARTFTFHNNSTKTQRIAIEPWALAYDVKPGGVLEVAFDDSDPESHIVVDVTDDLIGLDIYGDQPTVRLDGEGVWP